MKVGVISDTHDRLPAFRRAITMFERLKVQAVFHAGDCGAPFAAKPIAPDVLTVPLYCVYGNNDGERAGLWALLPNPVDGQLTMSARGDLAARWNEGKKRPIIIGLVQRLDRHLQTIEQAAPDGRFDDAATRELSQFQNAAVGLGSPALTEAATELFNAAVLAPFNQDKVSHAFKRLSRNCALAVLAVEPRRRNTSRRRRYLWIDCATQITCWSCAFNQQIESRRAAIDGGRIEPASRHGYHCRDFAPPPRPPAGGCRGRPGTHRLRDVRLLAF